MFVLTLQIGRAKADNSSASDTIAQALPILGALAPTLAEWWKRHELRRQRGQAERADPPPPPTQAEAQPGDIVAPDGLGELIGMVEILGAALTQGQHEITGELRALHERLDRIDPPEAAR